MTSEAQIYAKDKLKLNILQDVLGGLVNIGFQLSDGPVQDYASQIHADGKRVYVYGKFNISEDANEGNTITIRPIMIDTSLKITLHANKSYSGKKASIVRNATKLVEQEFEINSDTISIELIPQGKQFYLLRTSNSKGMISAPIPNTSQHAQRMPVISTSNNPVQSSRPTQVAVHFEEINTPVRESPPGPVDDRFEEFGLDTGLTGGNHRFDSSDFDPVAVVRNSPSQTRPDPEEELSERPHNFVETLPTRGSNTDSPKSEDGEIQRIEQEISVIEHQQKQLSRKKQSAIDHLEKIEAEYKKDYAAFEQELEDYKSRLDADVSIIEHYKDQDVIPLEVIFQEIRFKLDEAEEQIRYFIEAKQQKTMEIENEIKSNRK